MKVATIEPLNDEERAPTACQLYEPPQESIHFRLIDHTITWSAYRQGFHQS